MTSILNIIYEPQSEDCLFLNIWTPSLTGSLPVLVFVHGGGFIVGSSDDPTLNGSSISQNGPSVVVTLNYRLGSFGYLALSQLAGEDPHNSTGSRDTACPFAFI